MADEQCAEKVDILWERKRYQDVRCLDSAGHADGDREAEHWAVAGNRSHYWKRSELRWNRTRLRYELIG